MISKILPGLSRARGRWLPIALPALVPGSLCGMTHQFCVSHDIYLQETSCSVCLETRATALQVTIGAWLPFLSSIAGTLILGQQMRYKWVPRSSSGTNMEIKILAFNDLFSFIGFLSENDCQECSITSQGNFISNVGGWIVGQLRNYELQVCPG